MCFKSCLDRGLFRTFSKTTIEPNLVGRKEIEHVILML